MKICTACEQTKPLTDFYGYTDPHTVRLSWRSTCKVCVSEQRAVRSKGPSKSDLAREQRLRQYPGLKTCTGCGEEKSLADFGQPQRHDRAAGRIGLVFSARCLPCQSKLTMARQARSSA